MNTSETTYTKDRLFDLVLDQFSFQPKPTRNKFVTFCNYNNIPFPKGNARNSDHLKTCNTCQELWPIYWYFEHIICERHIEDVFETWTSILEDDRNKLLKVGTKLFKTLIEELVSSKMSGYIIFSRERHSNKSTTLSFTEKNKLILAEWNQLEQKQKDEYEKTANAIKKDKKNFLDNVPLFVKRKINEYKRLKKKKRKINNPKAPKNPFIIYVSDKWNKIKNLTTLTYQEFLEQSSKEWKSMNQSDKEIYTKQFEQQQSQFKKHKSEITKKKKLEKNSSQ